MQRRTTLKADVDDLHLLQQEARRRGTSLGAFLGEMVAREAAAIRAGRRPRVGVVSIPVSIAARMEEHEDDPLSTPYRSD